ncbi:unnamed protein product [Larinioides sclopetarius]|uniref:Uncharacterized protein n=1 Tax=Larinioides sclopetarius TaxID=280406 RepID=A0AAV1YXR1_9ARAC
MASPDIEEIYNVEEFSFNQLISSSAPNPYTKKSNLRRSTSNPTLHTIHTQDSDTNSVTTALSTEELFNKLQQIINSKTGNRANLKQSLLGEANNLITTLRTRFEFYLPPQPSSSHTNPGTANKTPEDPG